MSIEISKPSDLPYIVHLSKVHAEELGFLTRSAMATYLDSNRVTMARENGEPCGYFLTSHHRQQTRIFQACVQMDARGLGHAQSLLSDLIRRSAAAGCQRLTLHCRDGLASNGFWSACGFSCTRLIPGGGARRKIVNQWELRVFDALRNPSLPYAADFVRQFQAGAAPAAIAGTGSRQP